MKRYLLVLFFVPFFAVAQQGRGAASERPTITVVGEVVDSLTNNKLSFATVSFVKSETGALVTGGICNDKGVFSVDGVQMDSYNILIEYMGYSPKVIENLSLKPKRGGMSASSNFSMDPQKGLIYTLETVVLSKASSQIQEVELVEEKALVVQGIDRKVFNVSQDITSNDGSAIELMEKLPSVQVDIDGNVSLRGSDQVRLYVDGKPSMLSSSELLETMPASMIENVELITNPSAKFSPEGMAGIINIVLKKNKKAGLNGQLSASVAYPIKNNFTALLNRRSGKLNLFGSYSFMDRGNEFNYKSEMNVYDGDTIARTLENKTGQHSRLSHNFKGGVDFTPNQNTSFSLQGKYTLTDNLSKDTIDNRLFEVFSDEEGLQQENLLLTDSMYTTSNTDQNSWDIDFSGKHKFDNDLKMDFVINKSRNERDKLNEHERLLATRDSILDNKRYDDQFESKLDFSYGDEKDGKFEWGLSARTRKIDEEQKGSYYDITTEAWVNDTLISNHFIYSDEVYAAYLTYAKSIGSWSYQAGLRAEQMNSNSELVSADSYNNDYFEFYPSAHLNYHLDETASVHASYSRRVNRPRASMLNPFPRYSAVSSKMIGNPFLKPEFVSAFEIGYQKFAQGTTFSTSVYAKDISEKQNRFTYIDSNNVSITTHENMATAFDLGFEIMYSKQLTKTFNFMLSSNIYKSVVDASNLTEDFNDETWGSWSSFNFGYKKNGHKVQLSGWLSPSREIGQGTMKTMFSSDIAYSRPVLNDKGKLTVKYSDIFNTRKHAMELTGPNFDREFEFRRQSQFLTFSFSYNFGEQSKNKSYRKGSRGAGGDDMDGGMF